MNTYWRHVGPKVLISKAGRAYRRHVVEEVFLARARGLISLATLEGRIAVRIEAQPPDNRRRDIDNLLKVPLDALTSAGIWLDDSQIDELTIVRLPVCQHGRIKVVIDEMR